MPLMPERIPFLLSGCKFSVFCNSGFSSLPFFSIVPTQVNVFGVCSGTILAAFTLQWGNTTSEFSTSRKHYKKTTTLVHSSAMAAMAKVNDRKLVQVVHLYLGSVKAARAVDCQIAR